MKNITLKSLAAAACLLAATASHASLILVAPEDFSGTGLGAVNTVLTIQNNPSEAGSVSYNGTTDVITGDAKTGASQTLTRSVTELGLTSGSAVRVVFNASEPAGNSITLANLELNFYSPTGTLLFTSGAFASQTFADTFTGTGNSGFVFALDASQAAAAQAAVFTLPTFGNVRIGLSASATSSAGGLETFFVANSPTGGGGSGGGGNGQVPEPATVALLGLGLLGLGLARRKSASR